MSSSLDGTDAMNRQRRRTSQPKRRLTYWITFFAGILLVCLLINMYLAWNQDLYIVNGFGSPLTVSIDEGESITVQPQGHAMVNVGEGDHVAVVSREGVKDHIVEFAVENSFYERIGNDSAFVLNPGGRAVLMQRDIAYKTSASVSARGSHKICFGEEFFAFRKVSYAFKKPPDQVQMEGSYKIKRYVGAIQGRPVDLIRTFPAETQPDELLRFIEHFLNVNPNDRDLLWRYAAMAESSESGQRAVKFLRAGLDRRPICVDWHRMYQTLCDTGNDDEIIALYDKTHVPSRFFCNCLYGR